MSESAALWYEAGLPDISQITKMDKKYTKMAIKYQMAKEYTKLFHPKAFQNIPKLAFLV
jgi:uncharacterized protein YaeQ